MLEERVQVCPTWYILTPCLPVGFLSMNTTQPEIVTFLMAGCQRCGTTWVDAALREHPEVFLPSQKQTYFFDEQYDKGINWYLKHFDNVQESDIAVGEISS